MPRDLPGLAHLLLGQPDLAELLMRGLALKGALPSFSGSEFQPVVTALDLTDPEYDYLRRLSRYQGGASVAAVAAQFTYVVLGRANFGARDMIAAVQQIVIANNNAAALGASIYVTDNNALGVGGGQNLQMDDRLSTRSAFTIGSGTLAANVSGGLFGVLNVTIPANSTLVLPVDYVLTNRNGATDIPFQLWVQSNAVNVQMAVTFVWKERAALPSETR